MISYDTIHWIENKVDMSLGGLGLNDVRLVTLVAVKVESRWRHDGRQGGQWIIRQNLNGGRRQGAELFLSQQRNGWQRYSLLLS
jgi:hypothetical protein